MTITFILKDNNDNDFYKVYIFNCKSIEEQIDFFYIQSGTK